MGASTTPAEALSAFRRAEENGRPVLLVLTRSMREPTCWSGPPTPLRGRTAARCCCSSCTQALPANPRTAKPSLELGPLGDEAVADIARPDPPEGPNPPSCGARRRNGRHPPRSPPGRSCRFPARRGRACRRSQRGGRAATERGELRAAEADLSGDLLALRALDERGRRYRGQLDDALLPAVCPYLGLASFDPAHAEYFFGRERLVAELVARLVGLPLLAVSAVRGREAFGLPRWPAPGARERACPWPQRWVQAPMRPACTARGAGPGVARRASRGGARGGPVRGAVHGLPRRAGARGVPRHSGFTRPADRDRRVQSRSPCARTSTGESLLTSGSRASSARTRCWSGRCDATSFAAPSWSPHAGSGCEEPAPTDALIEDVVDEPGGLPLLSAALLEQWRERDGHVMRRAAYDRTGGVRGAVARLAEATYTSPSEPDVHAMDPPGRPTPARTRSAFVRRRVPLDELGWDATTTRRPRSQP